MVILHVIYLHLEDAPVNHQHPHGIHGHPWPSMAAVAMASAGQVSWWAPNLDPSCQPPALDPARTRPSDRCWSRCSPGPLQTEAAMEKPETLQVGDGGSYNHSPNIPLTIIFMNDTIHQPEIGSCWSSLLWFGFMVCESFSTVTILNASPCWPVFSVNRQGFMKQLSSNMGGSVNNWKHDFSGNLHHW